MSYVPGRMQAVTVIGGGLAGCEAAWQLARRGVPVRLYEMRPLRFSPAHTSEQLGELVCSNSLRSDRIHNAVGLLHEEMRRLGSLVLEAADQSRVPAGGALAVDRCAFARYLTERVSREPAIELVRQEVRELPRGTAIVATGPLTSDALAARIRELCGGSLYFYDSISPIVYHDSLDMQCVFRASRYEAGEGDYIVHDVLVATLGDPVPPASITVWFAPESTTICSADHALQFVSRFLQIIVLDRNDGLV